VEVPNEVDDLDEGARKVGGAEVVGNGLDGKVDDVQPMEVDQPTTSGGSTELPTPENQDQDPRVAPTAAGSSVQVDDNAGTNERSKKVIMEKRYFMGEDGVNVWRKGMEVASFMRDGIGEFQLLATEFLAAKLTTANSSCKSLSRRPYPSPTPPLPYPPLPPLHRSNRTPATHVRTGLEQPSRPGDSRRDLFRRRGRAGFLHRRQSGPQRVSLEISSRVAVGELMEGWISTGSRPERVRL
jgi:hypothetical protein